MNNSQLITNIKSVCKRQSIPFSEMLERCGLSKGFMYDVEKRDRSPSIDKITAIAEFLGVSVDYLLGRADEPEGMTQINTGDVGNNSSVNISKTACNCDDELVALISSLSLLERSKVVLFIDSLRQNENKG